MTFLNNVKTKIDNIFISLNHTVNSEKVNVISSNRANYIDTPFGKNVFTQKSCS